MRVHRVLQHLKRIAGLAAPASECTVLHGSSYKGMLTFKSMHAKMLCTRASCVLPRRRRDMAADLQQQQQ
jgi:hypothetical protein